MSTPSVAKLSMLVMCLLMQGTIALAGNGLGSTSGDTQMVKTTTDADGNQQIEKLAPSVPMATAPATNSASPAAAGGGFDLAHLRDESDSCAKEQSDSKGACGDPNSTKGMSSDEKAMLMMGLATLAQTAAQIAAAKGSAAACMLGQGVAGTLQTMTMLKSAACGRKRNSCATACKSARDDWEDANIWAKQNPNDPSASAITLNYRQNYKDAKQSYNACDGYSSNQMMMGMQMQQLMGSATQMAQCALQSKDNSVAAYATPAPLNLTTAAGDCSDPTFAATSIVCICKSNPSDPMCANGAAGAAVSPGGIAAGGIATPGITASSDGDGTVVDTSPFKTNPEAGKQAGGSGGAGGAGLAGGGAGGLNPEGGEGAAASGINKDVITGQTSAGGGLSASGGGGGGGGGFGRPSNSGSDGSGFNLSKYLPKTAYGNRGLAGMTVPAQDGVTGPMGPTIWEKFSTRYDAKRNSVLTLGK